MRLLGMAALAGVGVLAYRAMKKRKGEHSDQHLRPEAPTQSLSADPGALNGEQRQWGRSQPPLDDSFPN